MNFGLRINFNCDLIYARTLYLSSSFKTPIRLMWGITETRPSSSKVPATQEASAKAYGAFCIHFNKCTPCVYETLMQ